MVNTSSTSRRREEDEENSPTKSSVSSDMSHNSFDDDDGLEDVEEINTNQVEEYQIRPIQSQQSTSSRLSRTRTNHSELSRIISGIKDDQQLDEQNRNNYKHTGDAEYILANEIDRVATNIIDSRQHSTTDLELQRRHLHLQEINGSSRGPRFSGSPDDLSINDEEEEEENEKKGEFLQESSHKPDGGMAWLMAICAMMAMFSTWGANAGYGVFLNYYLDSNTFPEATKYDFALIGGIVVFMANILSPLSALLYKMLGFRFVCCIGIIFQTLGWICASFAKRIWHLYLTQGVLVGISFLLIFIPATLVLPTWFEKKKATSMGICVSGAGLGGLIFSLSVNKVIQETGNQRWALRMVGFVTLFSALLSALIMKPRNFTQPPLKESLSKTFIIESVKAIFDVRVFKNRGIILIALWFSIALIGYTLMLFSMSSYASSVGLSHSQGSILTSVMNAAQIVGRPSMGITADRIGRANFTASACLLITILLFAFWINATTFGSLIAFAVIIGLVIGVGSSLAQPLAADVLDPHMEQMPAAWSGINITVSFFCLVSEVIALALVIPGAKRPYLHTQIFAGSCFFACFLLMILIREFLIKKQLTSRLEFTKSKLHKVAGTTKSGYLRCQDDEQQAKKDSEDTNKEEEEEEESILIERVERYEQLLNNTFTGFFIRALYPIKV